MTAPAKRTLRTIAAERTRGKLIETGLELAEELGLEGLSVNAVVAGAGVSKGTFFHHFPDRTAYLVALHRRFHDALADEFWWRSRAWHRDANGSRRRPGPISTAACATVASRLYSARGTGRSPTKSWRATGETSTS